MRSNFVLCPFPEGWNEAGPAFRTVWQAVAESVKERLQVRAGEGQGVPKECGWLADVTAVHPSAGQTGRATGFSS